MDFVNRTHEIAALDEWWGLPGPQLGVVWGRRRVGKSRLLRHWGSGRQRMIFHVGRARPVEHELREVSRAVAAALDLERRDLEARPFVDWDDALETLAAAAEREPILLVLDEFPELLQTQPQLQNDLRAIWERIATPSTRLRVILCGSAVRTMEELQTERAPLFGRITLRLQLHPFTPHDSAQLLPAMSPVERAKAWGVCGGVPFYLGAWDQSASFRDNIKRLFCHEQALLLHEGELLLATEDIPGGSRERLPEQVLREIASGKTSYGALKSSIGTLPDRSLTALERMRLIQRIGPVTDRKSPLRYYRVADNFLAFWLTVLERHRDVIEQGQGPSVVSTMLAEFDDFMGARWEEALRAHLVRVTAAESLPGISDVVAVGEFWRQRVGPTEDPCQIDAVALSGRSRRVGLVGEAKWGKRVNGRRLVSDLERKVNEAKLSVTDELLYLVCAREQVVGGPDGMLTVTADDIFG